MRERTEIISQILALCTQKRRKTRIMYKTNLSHEQVKTYLALLISFDLLVHKSNEYMTTGKGHRFLETYAQLEDVLKDRASWSPYKMKRLDKARWNQPQKS